MPKKKTTFEEDMARLETIVEFVESSDTSLDAAIGLYKEGLELVSKCGKTLGKYEAEILTLQKDADDHFVTKIFSDKAFEEQ
ncbi:MAG: exodeoxyribonuclease VII small subunit [Defluviitaleaceae bacterium]|nr:exodeoxyribonuclease VII small subunit [Defluviitaleaceae bacterium]